MSWFSQLTGRDRHNERVARSGFDPNTLYDQAIRDEGAGGGWQKAFNDTAGAFLENQMPALRSQLQLTREDAQRRGIGTGDLGTSNEGDLVSAFQRNIANALGGLAMSGYENNRNRYLDLLSGRLDRNQASRNAQNGMWGSLFQTVTSPFSFAFGGGK